MDIVRSRQVHWTLALLMWMSLGCSSTPELPPLAGADSNTVLPGKFVWHNLITRDAEEARTFYGELFGWEFKVEADGKYSVISHRGRNIGGIFEPDDPVKIPKRGHWMSAVSVPDLESALRAVEAEGGKQLEAPIDVPGIGRVVTVEDADGALLHLLAPSKGDPPDGEPSVHEWLWHELLANDLDRALTFYQRAFGYTVKQIERDSRPDYHVLWSSDGPRAAVVQNPFDDVRSVWIPYVRVDDPDALSSRAEALGGDVIIRPQPEIRNGTLALVVDPSGAPVALQKWSPTASPLEVQP